MFEICYISFSLCNIAFVHYIYVNILYVCVYIYFPPSGVLLPKAFVLQSVLIIRQTFYKSSPRDIPPHSPGLDPLFPRLCSFLLYIPEKEYMRKKFLESSGVWKGVLFNPHTIDKLPRFRSRWKYLPSEPWEHCLIAS